MRNGIKGTALPPAFPYKAIIEQQCFEQNCSPCLVGAIKMNETGLGQGSQSENVISADGGHGLMQLTSSFPPDWADPAANFRYAIEQYINPAWEHWAAEGLSGDDLVRAIAATYNAGLGGAEAGHAEGDIGKYTTDHYDQRCLAHYQALVEGTIA